MRVLVISNPESGGRIKDGFLSRMKNEFTRYGISYELYETRGADDESGIKEMIGEMDPDSILTLGGDGTINLVASCMLDKHIPLGIIPYGSANGMAADLSIKTDPDQALDDFLKSRYVVETDILKVNQKFYCLHIGDVGLNAQIVEGYIRDKDRGIAGYAKHFIQELTQSELLNFHITADGKKFNENGYMMAFANARRYGTGVILNWKGNAFDGKFELIIAKSLELKTLILAGLSKYSNEIGEETMGLTSISCRKANIRFDKPMTVQVDGEILGKYSEVNIEIIPGAIKILRTNPEVE